MQSEIKNTNTITNAAKPSLGFVLIVDDEEQNRALLREPLEARGYEIEEAENGMVALEKIATRPPDVILLDVMMPQLDGFQVCHRLKTDPKTTHIPILMVTALSDRKERLMGITAGANDFLNKPVDIQDVMLRVSNAAHTKQLHDQLQAEKEKSERLLLNILPKPIAERIKKGETNIADSHPDVTVLVADLVGFTTLTSHIGAEQIVQLLNEIFSAFDLLTGKQGLEKIKTIGDAYLVAGGLVFPRSDHAQACADLALNMQKEIQQLNQTHGTSIKLRIGINTGPVVAGVIGRWRLTYDLWGETVNFAFGLESECEPGKIQIASSTYERLKGKFQFENQHVLDAKGHVGFPAYWLGKRIEQPAVIETGEKVAA